MWKRLACPHHVILYACTLYHIPLFYILAFSLVLFLWYNSRFYTCHILNEPIGRSGMSVLCLEDVTLLVRKRQLAAAPCYGLLLVTCWKATFTDRSSLWVVVRDLLKDKIDRSHASFLMAMTISSISSFQRNIVESGVKHHKPPPYIWCVCRDRDIFQT